LHVGEPAIRIGQRAPRRTTPRACERFLDEHGRKLWWLHSAYALALGAGVVAFAHKGFEHARWLAVSLGLAWLLVVLLFRLFAGQAAACAASRPSDAKTRVRFYVMTYALKNLYQGMLFFLLPFYWKSTTLDAPNVWFVGLLAPARSSPRSTSSSTACSCAGAGSPPSFTASRSSRA
jgi:hypothetical protein